MTYPLVARSYATAMGRMEAAVVDPSSGRSSLALLGIHGTPGDYRQARVFAEDFADRVTVILPSRPGYGRSPLSSGRTPVQQAAAYVALLDELGVERAVVVGISGGGPSAYALAAHHPNRCAVLVLCCAAAASQVVLPKGTARLASIPGLWHAITCVAKPIARRRLRDVGRVEREMVEALFPAELRRLEDDPRLREDLLQFAADRVEVVSGRGMRNDMLRALTPRAVDALGTVDGLRVPTVIVHGTADEVVAMNHAEWHHSAIEHSQLVALEGFGHALPATARQELGRVLMRALEG